MLVLLNYIQILYQNKYKSFCQQHPLQKKVSKESDEFCAIGEKHIK